MKNSSKVKIRKKKKTIKISRLASFITIIIAGVVLALAISGLRANQSIDSFLSRFGNGSGYPVTIDSSVLVSTQRLGSGILLVSNDAVEILNSTAKEIVRIQHTFLNPESDVSNGRAIIYSRASGFVVVIDSSGVIYKTDVEKNILTASIGKKGNIAIASQSNSAQSELVVLDKKGKTVFSWQCAAQRISAVALSDNGKSLAVAVVGAENTELYSRVLVFDFDKSTPVVEFSYPENTVIKLEFASRDTLIAVGDKMFSAIAVKENKKQDVSNGTGDVLEKYFVDESGKTTMILSSFGNKALSKLVVYGATGNLLFETQYNQEVKWVTCDKNYVAVLTQDEVQCLDNEGSRMGSFKADKYSDSVVVVGKHTYLFEKGLITQWNTVGLSR